MFVLVIHRISKSFLECPFLFFQADKYKNEPPNALELLKEMHYSKKKGFAPTVQSLIVSKIILSSQFDDTLDSYVMIIDLSMSLMLQG
jgi:hypothetical protein